MRLKTSTRVNKKLQFVKAGFNEQLFRKLSPPFPKVKLIQFDGSKTGDLVSLELDFLFFKNIWTSEIIADSSTPDSWTFIDKGTHLPFFLKSWDHKHLVKSEDKRTVIMDDIQFSCGYPLLDILLYPLILGQFIYRKPIYKSVFK